MMENDDTEYRSLGTKVPMFDGTAENWSFFKVKFQSYLARLGLNELRTSVGQGILEDGGSLPSSSDSEAAIKKEALRLQKMNQKAAWILLNAILTDTDEGKAAFHLIEKLHTDEYSG